VLIKGSFCSDHYYKFKQFTGEGVNKVEVIKESSKMESGGEVSKKILQK
jgi:hypothetical protein